MPNAIPGYAAREAISVGRGPISVARRIGVRLSGGGVGRVVFETEREGEWRMGGGGEVR